MVSTGIEREKFNEIATRFVEEIDDTDAFEESVDWFFDYVSFLLSNFFAFCYYCIYLF